MALREYDFDKEPTVSVVKKILTDAVNMKATDIHFDPTPDELIIKFRINNELNEYTIAPDNVKINIITRIKIISGMNITNSMLPQTGAISFELDNKPHNMRVSSLPVLDGEKIVIHLSSYAKNIKNISKLGFNENNTEKIKELLKKQQGIILITGNTNSGKTTTTYSILKELNNKSNNIISIEDPIKMKIKGINQVSISPEKGLTYRNILKAVMLQDPNIIAINELIDDETTRSALRASLTGRLVISTMYTKTIYETISNLLDMDIENYLLASNLQGIISQRMVKKLCPTCRQKKKAGPYEAKVIEKILGKDIEELYYPNGCEDCQNGYIDQIPIEETIIIDDELRNAIANNKPKSLIRKIIYSNNESIIKNGLEKAIDGETSFEEILRVLDLNNDFSDEEKDTKNLILGKEKPIEETKKEKEVEVEETIKGPIKVEGENEQELKPKTPTTIEDIYSETTSTENKETESNSKEENNIKDDDKQKDENKELTKKILDNINNDATDKLKNETKTDEKESEETKNEEQKEAKNIVDEKTEEKEITNEEKVKEENKEINIKEEINIEINPNPVTEPENKKEETKIEKETITNPQTVEITINNPTNDDEDDDDDDDFSYGDSYKIEI